MEPLFLLTIPRYDLTDFGSLDEDYLCLEEQLEWYVSNEFFCPNPVRILEHGIVHEEDISFEYTDGEWKDWYFWLGAVDADVVYIRQEDRYRRCVKVNAENVLLLQRKTEEEERGCQVGIPAYKRLDRVSGYSGILRISELSPRDCAESRDDLHNRVTSNLYYLEREFDTMKEVRSDLEQPSPVDLRRFFQDLLEQK